MCIREQHTVTRFDGVGVQFYGGTAALEFVGFYYSSERKFALFANWHKAHVQFVSHSRTQNKAARSQPRHHVGPHAGAHVAMYKSVDQDPKYLGVLQQWCDVAKLHARCRPI